MKKEIAIVQQETDYRTLYDFRTFGLKKRVRMAIALIIEGGFRVTGLEKNKNINT